MTIKELRKIVSKHEGGKVNLTIAQISETLRAVNTATNGRFYQWIRKQQPE